MLNQVTLIGRVGKDPEIRAMPNGANVANFSIATTEKWTDKASGEKKEFTEWTDVVVFGKGADVVSEYVGKGDAVSVVGKLRTDKYEKDGVEHRRTKVIVDRVVLLPRAEKGDAKPTTQSRAATKAAEPATSDSFDDDIPF